MLRNNSVSAQRVLEADLQIRAIGVRTAIQQLERDEADLANYVMESASRLYGDLDRACTSHRRAKSVHRQSVQLVLVSVEAVRGSA
jgi:hypothetical protein